VNQANANATTVADKQEDTMSAESQAERLPHTSIVARLRARAALHPKRQALRFLRDGEGNDSVQTYEELDGSVRALAARLQGLATPGERALLLYPNGVEYVHAFLGCLYAGLVAVPAYPPESSQPHHLARLLSVARDARPKLVLTEAAWLEPLRAARAALPELASIELAATDDGDAAFAEGWRSPADDPKALAFLQYTSGSTSRAKGVMVSHANLMANQRAIQRAFSMREEDVVVSWLPLFHDMGLIGTLLQPLYNGASTVLLTPQSFIKRPMAWLEAISRYRGTVSGGPDFAYRMCVERAHAAAASALDLSSWELAFSGAEPVRAATLRAFADKFTPFGLNPKALYSCYGLAESCLLVTGGERGRGAIVAGFDERALGDGRVVPSAEGRPLVGCGRAQPEHALQIVDPSTGHPLTPGLIGEIVVRGPSVTEGYYQNAEATRESFRGPLERPTLFTGDLGFEYRGELFVTGRIKDLIIVRGHNLYPQDIERSVEEAVTVLRKGRIAAFATELDGEESIGVAAEVSPRMQAMIEPERVCRAISEAVAQAHGQPASTVLLLEPGALPITSSGKLQRTLCRKRWQDKALAVFASLERGGFATTASTAR
jgi:acyl-CoA synthetase (AMP-forming)/AMP-acid ligase II